MLNLDTRVSVLQVNLETIVIRAGISVIQSRAQAGGIASTQGHVPRAHAISEGRVKHVTKSETSLTQPSLESRLWRIQPRSMCSGD